MTKNTLAAIALLGSLAATPAVAQVDAETISRATLPLPESLRAEAGVFNYDASGNRVTLRKGANAVECKTRDAKDDTWCYPTSTAARRDYSAKLAAGGLEGDALAAAMAQAEADGTIQPTPAGSMLYRLDETEGGIKLLWAVMLPNTTAADLGISSAGRFKSAVAGKGTPWMMAEGTPQAHLMLPVNGTDLSNPGGADASLDPSTIEDPVARATLPLPADLRDGAMVVTYDPKTGERSTLREGSNTLACVTRDPATGYTRCAHKDNLAETDMRMTMAAEGKSAEDIDAAVMAAIEAGEIPERTFGGLAYRMYDTNDKLRLLWVLRLPGATAADTGVPTVPDREGLGAGKGTPWLMREGHARAHLMIPVNGTELSNFY